MGQVFTKHFVVSPLDLNHAGTLFGGTIMAHADDEMRCLGTMMKCGERGDRLAFVTVTDGCHGYVQDPTLPCCGVACPVTTTASSWK